MQNTFVHKFLMAMVAGFAAACLIWGLRHIVNQAFYESGEGWRDMFSNPAPKSAPPKNR